MNTNQKQEKKEEVTSVLQEIPTNDKLKEAYNNKLAKASEFYAVQSQKVSDNIRKIVWVIIGTIWIICYQQNSISLPNGCLIAAAILSFSCLALDVLHYYFDSIFYFNKAKYLKNNEITEENFNRVEVLMDEHESTSYTWMNVKFYFACATVICFIIGIILLIHAA